jgi:hypothetical protein
LQADSVDDALTLAITDNRQIQTFRWANAAARAAQTGMVAGDMGYQVDTGIQYQYTGSAWLATPEDTGWIAPTLGTGWSISAGNTIGYRRRAGVVYMRGRATSTGATITAFTLPAGFRPSNADNLFTVDAAGPTRANVTSAGAVQYLGGGAVTSMSLASISFLADS